MNYYFHKKCGYRPLHVNNHMARLDYELLINPKPSWYKNMWSCWWFSFLFFHFLGGNSGCGFPMHPWWGFNNRRNKLYTLIELIILMGKVHRPTILLPIFKNPKKFGKLKKPTKLLYFSKGPQPIGFFSKRPQTAKNENIYLKT